MKIKALLFFALLLTVVACSTDGTSRLSEEEAAQAAAEEYYDALYNDQVEVFLHGRANAEEMPESFRKTMLTNLRQHVAGVKAAHVGVKSVHATRAEKDSATHIVHVFLLLKYHDKTEEEILVPMIRIDDEWRLK